MVVIMVVSSLLQGERRAAGVSTMTPALSKSTSKLMHGGGTKNWVFLMVVSFGVVCIGQCNVVIAIVVLSLLQGRGG